MAPKGGKDSSKGKGKPAAGDGKGKDEEKKGGGKLKGAQQVNVRHILVCLRGVGHDMAWANCCFYSARSIRRRKRR